MSTLHHAQPLSLCAANGQMQGQHPKGEHVEGMNLKSQCLGPKGLSKNKLSSLCGTKWSQHTWLHFLCFKGKSTAQSNNKWLDGNSHIHSFTLQNWGANRFLEVQGRPNTCRCRKTCKVWERKIIPNCHMLQVSQTNSGKCLKMIEGPHHLQTHALPTGALPYCETQIHRLDSFWG